MHLPFRGDLYGGFHAQDLQLYQWSGSATSSGHLREVRGGGGGNLRGHQCAQTQVSHAQFTGDQFVWHQFHRRLAHRCLQLQLHPAGVPRCQFLQQGDWFHSEDSRAAFQATHLLVDERH